MSDAGKEYMEYAVALLRVNIKSLAEEARIIRKEMKRYGTPWVKGSLASHRKTVVRAESRSAHLALAAVKGVPYKSVEKNPKTRPDWNRVSAKLKMVPYYVRKSADAWVEKSRK